MQNLFWVVLKESANFGIVVIDRKVAFKLAHKKLAWMCGIDFCPNVLLILSINKLSEMAGDNYTELCRECVIQSEYFTAPCSGMWRTHCRRGCLIWLSRRKYASYSWCRDGVVGVVTALWLDNRGMVFRFLVGKKRYFSSTESPGSLIILFSVEQGQFPGGKFAMAWSWHLTSV
jgi:hypothetical protein